MPTQLPLLVERKEKIKETNLLRKSPFTFRRQANKWKHSKVRPGGGSTQNGNGTLQASPWSLGTAPAKHHTKTEYSLLKENISLGKATVALLQCLSLTL